MKRLSVLPQIAFVLVLLLLLITSNLRWEVNALKFYEYGFDKYNISQKTGLTREELSRAAAELISYLNSDHEPLRIQVRKNGQEFDLFNQREVVHLRDVKDLVRLDSRVQLGALFFILTYVIAGFVWLRKRFIRHLARAVLWSSLTTLALMLMVALAILLGFDSFFLTFHLVSFSNQFWILDPTKDYLIMMFPEGFFYQAAILLAGATIIEALLLGGVAWVVSGRYRS